ncbi:ABC transporter ATP-binding protein [Winogradskyella echinorum]|uniref:ABC transporter ATP-binding protein n=1 Tax=Winogradskyella echinorum TaxID=538189 RepID=A0ABR6Y2I3_9FLAO|nr:ABC transporter ATP-binding protein [Winogradskyella echinorum]MBC3846952.1 ABC transporter ATP-binding protein [Winogradskyella echinorum]MBC5751300.1 ABC transporter ATP-binding protein [Winogradskyella echinorum]
MSSDVILKVENVGKQYRLGLVGTGTISHDLNRWWNSIRGKEDPYLKVGESNNRSEKGNSDYVWAIKNINFEVKRGEVLGIIGKNGAGKSTLLKILSRVTGPTTGQIKTKGRIASLLEVGTGFHPEMTGRENIYLNGAILGMTKAEINSKIDEIIDFSGCLRYVDTPVKRYSSGMKVRLAFAVAAHLEPDILVVDEVLAVGDAEFQKKAIGKMQDISHSDGRTVLFVSHNMAAVKNLCSRAVVLDNGESIFDGTSDQAVNFYLNLQSSKNTENLLTRTDRKGTGEIRFSKVELLNQDGNAVTEIISGEYAKFRLHMVFNRDVNYKDLIFGLVIYDNNENKIADFYSDEMGIVFDNIDSYVDLELNKLMLRGGDYYIAIAVQTAIRVVQQIDVIHHVLNIKVFSGDYWVSSKNNRATNVALIDGIFGAN